MYIAKIRVKFNEGGNFGVQKKIEEALKAIEGFDHIDGISVRHIPNHVSAKAKVMDLSDNQHRFVEDAVAAGLEIDWSYSGRGMHGAVCPAVHVDEYEDFETTSRCSKDRLGLGTVYYARY